jgi:response regulator RpfG family c-di-GMP phosphodiesterase
MSETNGNTPACGTVLVVDDEPAVCRIVERVLGGAGHAVVTVNTVAAALDRLAEHPFDVVLTDLRLPGPSGLDLLVEVRSRAPDTRLILMTGHGDLSTAAAAIDTGVDQLIPKPFDNADLLARVESSLARARARRQDRREREVLEARLRQRDTESKIWILRAAHALAHAVEAKDPYTAGHARRVTGYAMTLAEQTGGVDLLSFRLAGDLHDVGKIGVPDSVLGKPERLTRREFDQVRKHPVIGARILKPLIDDPLVIGVVRHHHERWDGLGYPDGLKAEAIPFPARVLAVADTLDAMTSLRAYRDGMPWETAVAVIRDCAGTQFDPAVVAAFDATLDTLHRHYVAFHADPVPPA